MHGECEKPNCNRYSDVDVYYKDGSSAERCSAHAMWPYPSEVTQVIPQHGGDNVNREIEK